VRSINRTFQTTATPTTPTTAIAAAKPMSTSDVLATSVAVVALQGIRRPDNYRDNRAKIIEQLWRINPIFFRASNVGPRSIGERIFEK